MLTTIRTKLQMNAHQQQALNQLMLRDTRIMNRILGIMRFEEGKGQLFKQSTRGSWSVTRSDLASLMLSTENRAIVKYDLKHEFLTISHNELMECIDNAAEMYKSYLELRSKGERVSHPHIDQPITRRIGYRRFNINRDDQISSDQLGTLLQLSIMDSRKSNYRLMTTDRTRIHHDYLSLQFYSYDRLEDYLDLGKAKSITITRDGTDYFVNITIELDTDPWQNITKFPLGVIGIDLGINKTITAVLYTEQGIVERKMFNDQSSKQVYIEVDKRIGKLQQQLYLRSIKVYLKNFRYYRRKIKNQVIKQGISLLLDQIYTRKSWQSSCQNLVGILQNMQQTGVLKRYEQKLLQRLQQFQVHAGEGTANIFQQLRDLKHRREQIKDNMIKQLCIQIQEYVDTQRKNYNLYISLGDISGIRKSARRGNGMKQLRKRVNFWAYYKLSTQLHHDLAKIGMDDRLLQVREAWTSILCYKCNEKGVRNRQSTFQCVNPQCEITMINADINGAANIAKRLILYKKLVSYKEMMQTWHIPQKAIKRRSVKQVV